MLDRCDREAHVTPRRDARLEGELFRPIQLAHSSHAHAEDDRKVREPDRHRLDCAFALFHRRDLVADMNLTKECAELPLNSPDAENDSTR